MAKTKLVIFDAYGVILNGGYIETMKELGKLCNRDEKELYDIIYKKYFNMAAEKKITQKDAWVNSMKELGLSIDWKKVRDIHYSLMSVNNDMGEFALDIGKDTNTLLLSKNTRSQFRDAEKMLNFRKFFKNAINTWELGLPKASEKTHEYIFKKFNVKPDEIIYIDDQDENLFPAKNLGIHTILYKDKSFSDFKKEFFKVYEK